MSEKIRIELFAAQSPATVLYACTVIADASWMIERLAGERLSWFGSVSGADRARATRVDTDGTLVWESHPHESEAQRRASERDPKPDRGSSPAMGRI